MTVLRKVVVQTMLERRVFAITQEAAVIKLHTHGNVVKSYWQNSPNNYRYVKRPFF